MHFLEQTLLPYIGYNGLTLKDRHTCRELFFRTFNSEQLRHTVVLFTNL